jgi:predicted transcriptional regulator
VHIKLYRLVDVGYIKQLNEIGVKYFSLTEKGESFVRELGVGL